MFLCRGCSGLFAYHGFGFIFVLLLRISLLHDGLILGLGVWVGFLADGLVDLWVTCLYWACLHLSVVV